MSDKPTAPEPRWRVVGAGGRSVDGAPPAITPEAAAKAWGVWARARRLNAITLRCDDGREVRGVVKPEVTYTFTQETDE